MQGECLFRQNEFPKALESFTQGLDDPNATSVLRQSALLHAAQAAGGAEQWDRCLALADRAIAEFPSAGWVADARCERGTALFKLDRLDEAQQELAAIAGNGQPSGARAEFTLGKIHIARGDYEVALRSFFKVAYGYGDAATPAAIREWQAESLYEAAQCLEDTNRVESARKLYEELVARHPDSAKAPSARQALQQSLQR
jgi:TolA-binding protein